MRRGLFGEINAVLFITALKRAADFRGKGAGNIEKPRPCDKIDFHHLCPLLMYFKKDHSSFKAIIN